MEAQLFDFPKLEITNKIRLIELFGEIGSQAMALRDIGADFEHYRLVEFDKYAVASYNAIHGTSFETADIRNVHGADLGIVDRDKKIKRETSFLAQPQCRLKAQPTPRLAQNAPKRRVLPLRAFRRCGSLPTCFPPNLLSVFLTGEVEIYTAFWKFKKEKPAATYFPPLGVSSAQESLTSVFGMGTGIASPLWPPAFYTVSFTLKRSQ